MSRKKRDKADGKKKANQRDSVTVSLAHLEQVIVDESLSEGEFEAMVTPCRLHIHSKRKRLTDADGVSAKAAIDGAVHAGLLQDDSPEFVQEVSYSQEKAKTEETIIELWVNSDDE